MWYAVEYAYGSAVANNGNKADKTYTFSSRRLRDAWIADGPPDTTASGCRAAVGARHPLVRRAMWEADGDAEAWLVLARQRVEGSAALGHYRAVILDTDWTEGAEHYRWVATAPEREIVSWARATSEAARA